jgi:hypothetical protein
VQRVIVLSLYTLSEQSYELPVREGLPFIDCV